MSTASETDLRAADEPLRAGWLSLPADRLWFGFVLLGTVLIVVAAFLPLWTMTLRAPQYPKGVHLTAYGTTMTGELQEVNTLNHYAGIKAIDPDNVFELRLFPFAVAGIAAVLVVGAFKARRRRWRTLVSLLAWSLPIGFLMDLQYWLYNYGHDLEPQAPLRIDPFTPKVIGTTKVVNFHSETMVTTGFWFMLAAAALISFGPMTVRFLRDSWRNTGSARPVAGAAGLLLLVLAPLAGMHADAASAAEPASSIASAIAKASPGDTVTIPPGTYNEQVTIDKPIALVGVGWPVIDGGRKGDVVVIAADGVTLRGFVIQASGRDVADEPTGVRANANRATIENNRLRDILYGITLENSDGHVVRDNTISSIAEFNAERRGHAIYLYSSSHNMVERNTIDYSKDGFFFGFSTDNDVIGNRVSHMRYGIHYMYADNNRFTGNVFTDGVAGAAIMFSRKITLIGNEFSENRSIASGYGILFKDVDDVEMRDNLIHHNRLGMSIEGAPHTPGSVVNLTHNLIGFNQLALELSTTTGMTLTDNTFIGNLDEVATKGGSLEHRNTWAVAGRGNYWDEYQGYDADGNGLGDLPFRYEGAYDDLVQRNEALRAYSYTPARAALDLAARWFPVFRPEPRVVDPAPLMSPTVSLPRHESAGSRALSIAITALLVAVPLLIFRFAATMHRGGWGNAQGIAAQ